MLSIRK